MAAFRRAIARCWGLGPLGRLRLRLWLGKRVHAAIAAAHVLGAGGGRSTRAPLVLLYHRLTASRRRWEPTRALEVPADLFRAQMDALRERFRVVPLDRLLDPAPAGSLPHAAVTFDDGYIDTFEIAYPLLKALGIPAAVFVTTRWLGEEAPLWWYELEDLARRGALGQKAAGARWVAYGAEVSRLKTLPESLREARLEELRRRAAESPSRNWAPRMLSTAQLLAMDRSGLWTIGGHSHTHPILTRISLAEAQAEIGENKRILEGILGHPVHWFAYPNGGAGDFAAEHADVLRRAGFRGALSGISPWEEDAADPFRIPRLSVSGLEGLAEFRNHLRGLFWPR